MQHDTDLRNAWLTPEDLEAVRAQVPMVYVEALPVRVDETGTVTHAGLLMRAQPDGSFSRALVSGRVLHGERIRSALLRHLEKDLGPVALPRLPPSPAPFTVVEYFPHPEVSGFHDPRHHAVSLAFVVPIDGDCQPSQQTLDLAWLTPTELAAPQVLGEMSGGQDRLVRMALAHVGTLH